MSKLDAIADPVRLAVVRFLRGRAASTKEIADGVGIHLNTARSHLRALADRGVVERRSEPGRRRGRPLVRYQLRNGWRPAGDELLGLARLMAMAIGKSGERWREEARRWGRAAISAGTGSSRADLEQLLADLGFEAAVSEEGVRLSSCPCPLVSPDRPAAVCGLVDAAIEGALEGRDLRARARRHDPAARRCRVGFAPA